MLEFDISGEDSERLMRLPALSAYRAGRMKKSVRSDRVWQDTPDGALAAQGLILSESRGKWRLEALSPEAAPAWLPATPTPILAEAQGLSALAPHLPGGAPAKLAPIAAFEGSFRELPLRFEGAAARIGLLEGKLRGVVRQVPARRLFFFGEPRGMAALAETLSSHIALKIPLAGMGAAALALARGQPQAARRLGAPTVPPGADVDEAFTLIVAHLADVALYWGAQIGQVASPEPVHQMRVGVRRLRSALSIFRRALRDDAAWLDTLAMALKDLAATLGVARDWDVFLAGTGADVQRALPGDRRVAQMMEAAIRRRAAAYGALHTLLVLKSDAWRHLAVKLALLPTRRPWQDAGCTQAERLADPAQDYAAAALDRRLKHLLASGESLIGLPLHQLHTIRKQAKRMRYSIEFFAPLFPAKSVRKYLARLEALQEDFGALNDAAVAAELVGSLGGGADRAFAAGAVQGFVAARQERTLRRMQACWERLYRATPFWE